MVWNALKKMAGAAIGAGIDEATKKATKEVMEAAMAGAALVVYADGTAEKAEVEKLEKFVQTHPALKVHAERALPFFRGLAQQFELDYDMASDLAHKELREISSPADKQVVMRLAIAIAKADAEGIEETEVVAIKAIGSTLGLDATKYLPS